MRQPTDSFAPLALSTLRSHTGYTKPHFFSPNPVKVSSPALEVMTDLRFVPASTVHPEVDVMSATQIMIAHGVRLLLVVDAMDDVIGLITSRDLLDETYDVMGSSTVNFGKIKVSHVMTVADHIGVIPLEAVLHAHVGDIIETLKQSARQHAVVVEEETSTGKAAIRGIFSAAQIARQLGIVLQKHNLFHTFAEIDRAVTNRAGR